MCASCEPEKLVEKLSANAKACELAFCFPCALRVLAWSSSRVHAVGFRPPSESPARLIDADGAMPLAPAAGALRCAVRRGTHCKTNYDARPARYSAGR